jgi:hypothetical protein
MDEDSRGKTIVDLALQELLKENKGKFDKFQRSEYTEIVLAQIKSFILAGHHATSQAM